MGQVHPVLHDGGLPAKKAFVIGGVRRLIEVMPEVIDSSKINDQQIKQLLSNLNVEGDRQYEEAAFHLLSEVRKIRRVNEPPATDGARLR
jgi:hypothetical protein